MCCSRCSSSVLVVVSEMSTSTQQVSTQDVKIEHLPTSSWLHMSLKSTMVMKRLACGMPDYQPGFNLQNTTLRQAKPRMCLSAAVGDCAASRLRQGHGCALNLCTCATANLTCLEDHRVVRNPGVLNLTPSARNKEHIRNEWHDAVR